MTGIDRGRLIQERWLTLLRWLLVEIFFLALYLDPDLPSPLGLPSLLEIRLAPILAGFAGYTLVVSLLVMIRKTWPPGLAYVTATVDSVLAAVAAGSWSGEVVSPGLVGVAVTGVAVGVRRFPIFETTSYCLILAVGLLAARFAFTLRWEMDPQAAAVLGIVCLLPLLIRAVALDAKLAEEDEPVTRLSNQAEAGIQSIATASGTMPDAALHATASSFGGYTDSPVAGIVVYVDETTVQLYTVADTGATVTQLTEQGGARFGPRMLALSQPTTLDSRDQLDAQGLPEQYPSRLNAVAGIPIVGLPDLKATLFAINSRRGTYTKDQLVMGKLLAQELGRCLLLRDLALTGDQARVSATESLLAAAEAKRPGSRTQARECARFAEAIARELGWEEAQVQELRLAALLHDVGELAVPDPLLDKPAPLTPEEFEIVRQHPRHASRIIDFFNRSDLVLTAVLNHHERWDGRGYPSGLGGADIPQAGRILCLADAMESMLSSKVYRPDFTSTQALQEVLLGSGTQFDPTVVQAFLAVLRREGESFLEPPPLTAAPAAPPA